MPNQDEAVQFLRYLLMCSTHPTFDLKAHVPRIQRILGIEENPRVGFAIFEVVGTVDPNAPGISDLPGVRELIRWTSLSSDQAGDELVHQVLIKLWRDKDPDIPMEFTAALTKVRKLSVQDAGDLITQVLKQVGHYND